jgi:hypothetical protein
MALTLKLLTQIASDVKDLFITDKTGEYDASDNTGGWGAPNPELNQSALLAQVVYKASTGDVSLEAVGSPIRYNPAASNTDESQFQFTYVNDGYHIHYLMRLPASNDGSFTLEGFGINEGDYFYFIPQSDVYVKQSGENVLVTDYTVLIGDSNISQSLCEDLWLGELTVERSSLYLQYREDRNSGCDISSQFQELRALTEDLIGADYTFRSGLQIQAQDQVETLLSENNL